MTLIEHQIQRAALFYRAMRDLPDLAERSPYLWRNMPILCSLLSKSAERMDPKLLGLFWSIATTDATGCAIVAGLPAGEAAA